MTISLRTLVLACAVGVVGCAPARPGIRATPGQAFSQGADHAEIVGAADALFAAMRARDTTALREMFAPEVRIVSIRIDTASVGEIRSRPVSDFIASVGRSREELVERMWEPRIEVAGDVASLWAPYDFHIGQRFSHCGHDAFHFVRNGGRWRIVALTYTVRQSHCASPGVAGAPFTERSR